MKAFSVMARTAGMESTAKSNVGGFDHQKHDQQRRRVEARVVLRVADEELSAMVVAGDRDDSAQRLHQRILRGIDLMLARTPEIGCR